MNAIVKTNKLVDHFSDFFAPVSPNLIESLLKQYGDKKLMIERLDATMKNDKIQKAMKYFMQAHKRLSQRDGSGAGVTMAYHLEATLATLDAEFWEMALNLTDVKNHMNQDRRSEWFTMIRECKCQSFEQETVVNTIRALLLDRAKFLAEGVDGMFRKLSGEHVTNSPNGFNKRMIMANVMDPKWNSINYDKAGHIDDLRKIIAQFMGREFVGNTTGRLLEQMTRHFGEWVTWDGGSVKARLYKKGTVHLEIHPDIAWRLNTILAYLHPMTLTEGSLKKPAKVSKDFEHLLQPLSFHVIDALSELVRHQNCAGPIKLHQGRVSNSRDLEKKVKEVLFSLGGTMIQVPHVFTRFGKTKQVDAIEFDYDARDAISHVIMSGCLPDKKSHQYYPTPENLATELIELAEIDNTHSVLEPSAGQGGIADLLPNAEEVVCVEISALHCKILKAKSFITYQADFIDFSIWPSMVKFDRIVMNPPFSEGRAKAHLEAAVACLKDKGVITAILPSGLRNKEIGALKGFTVEWSDIRHNEFADASVSVVLMKAVRGDK